MAELTGIEKLLSLVNESPELRVLPLVYSEVVGDVYGSHFGSLNDAYYAEVWDSGDHLYVRSDEEEELINLRYELLASEAPVNTVADERRLMELAEDEVRNLGWEKVIVVYVDEYGHG